MIDIVEKGSRLDRYVIMIIGVGALSEDDSTDSSDNPERRRQNRRPSRPRRRNDPSPDGSDSSDDGGSSEENDRLETTRAGSKHFRIKLQTFDGTGSWESW